MEHYTTQKAKIPKRQIGWISLLAKEIVSHGGLLCVKDLWLQNKNTKASLEQVALFNKLTNVLMDTDSVFSQIKFYHNSSNRIKNISASNTTYWCFLFSYALVQLQ